jgi:hypothetical protein
MTLQGNDNPKPANRTRLTLNRRTQAQDEVWYQKQRIWRHNSFRGHCAMGRQQMNGIINSDSATDRAKQLASDIQYQMGLLADALKTRVDP